MYRCPYCGKEDYAFYDGAEKYGYCCQDCFVRIERGIKIVRLAKCKRSGRNEYRVLKEANEYIAYECKKCGDLDVFLEINPQTNIINNLKFENKESESSKEVDFCLSSQVRCPKCSSTQITTGSRGYSLAWGFIGAGKTVNRCAKCGYSWQPKK